jgi:hypothetical protein
MIPFDYAVWAGYESFFQNYHPTYTLSGFNLTTSVAGGDDTSRPGLDKAMLRIFNSKPLSEKEPPRPVFWHRCKEWSIVCVSDKPFNRWRNFRLSWDLNPGLPNDAPALHPHTLKTNFHSFSLFCALICYVSYSFLSTHLLQLSTFSFSLTIPPIVYLHTCSFFLHFFLVRKLDPAVLDVGRIARFFLRQCTKAGKNVHTKFPQNYQMTVKWSQQNGSNIFQMGITSTNIFHSKALQPLPSLGFLVWKWTIWQPWM